MLVTIFIALSLLVPNEALASHKIDAFRTHGQDLGHDFGHEMMRNIDRSIANVMQASVVSPASVKKTSDHVWQKSAHLPQEHGNNNICTGDCTLIFAAMPYLQFQPHTIAHRHKLLESDVLVSRPTNSFDRPPKV